MVIRNSNFPDIPEENLPKEYGGTVLTINEMVELWKIELNSEKSTRIMELNSKIELNTELLVQNMQENNSKELYGSFRKLEVD